MSRRTGWKKTINKMNSPLNLSFSDQFIKIQLTTFRYSESGELDVVIMCKWLNDMKTASYIIWEN